jgi:hypothetical protein
LSRRLKVTRHIGVLLLLRALGAVLGTTLRTTFDRAGVEGSAKDVIANTGKVANTTTTDEHDRVLLKIVPLTADVCGDLFAVRKTHTCDLPQSGVGLLGRLGFDLDANAAFLRAAL